MLVYSTADIWCIIGGCGSYTLRGGSDESLYLQHGADDSSYPLCRSNDSSDTLCGAYDPERQLIHIISANFTIALQKEHREGDTCKFQHTTHLQIYAEHLSLLTSSVPGPWGEDDGTDCFGAANEKSVRRSVRLLRRSRAKRGG